MWFIYYSERTVYNYFMALFGMGTMLKLAIWISILLFIVQARTWDKNHMHPRPGNKHKAPRKENDAVKPQPQTKEQTQKPVASWDKDHMHSRRPEAARKAVPSVNAWTENWKEVDRERIAEANAAIRRICDLDKPAKNVIFMMGDGLGISTLTAARFYLAQERNVTGKDAKLAWEKMPFAALSKTYPVDEQTPDSAATATAMVCGEKTSNGIIGLNQDAIYNDCASQAGKEVTSILHHAVSEGKWTGVITTARVTHASPASVYSHAANRNWEADSDLPAAAIGVCPDIASQFIDNPLNKEMRVLLGGGRQNFLPNTVRDPEYVAQFGDREDGRNLVEEWLQDKAYLGLSQDQYAYVWNLSDFNNIDPVQTEYLMGLFEPSHMQYELERTDEPSLADMVEKSVQVLERSTEGYFLFVEGGRVDHAHHGNNAKRALGDALALSDAVERALQVTNENDTLIVVSSDHSHVFTMAGYSAMGTNIFQYDSSQYAEDNKPYSTLGYTNGPGFYQHRVNLSDPSDPTEKPRMDQSLVFDQMDSDSYLQDAGIPLDSETHGAEDVAIFARGPMSHIFMGTQEQSYIGNAMMYALCVGDNQDLCLNPPPPLACGAVERPKGTTSTSSNLSSSVALLVGMVVAFLVERQISVEMWKRHGG